MRARRPSGFGDPLLRAVSRATSAASTHLDPTLVPANAADALVRYLGARRADVWQFDGRSVVHLASSGVGNPAPRTLPAALLGVARGGLAQSTPIEQLGAGIGAEWRTLLSSIDAAELSVHALVVGEQVLGAITVVPEGVHDDTQLEAITIFAQQVAAILEKSDLHRAAQDAAMSMRVQNRLLSELTDERDVPSLRRAVEQLVSDIFVNASIALLPVDSAGRLTVPELAPPSDGTLRIATEPEVALVLPLLACGDAVAIESPSPRWCSALGLRAWTVPDAGDATFAVWGIRLRTGARTTGVLLVGLPHTGRDVACAVDGARICDLLQTLATAVSIALENARLFAREHVRASRLSAAHSLARTVTGCASRDELFGAVVLGIGALFGYTRTATYDTDLHQLSSAGARPKRNEMRERSLVSTALHRRQPSRVERPDRTCHAIPLISGDRIHAVLYAEQPDSVTPEQSADDLVLLRSVCEHASACLVAIEASERIERNYKDTIQALVHAIEARDQYTADHSGVVAEWALETGRRIGMDDDDLRDLELGAILHDIGKVAIPDNILNKPGRLTEDEFEMMKSHTVVGERILRPIGFLEQVAPIVRHEHERWDGRGYPDGIAGKQIPLASRIIFVCDAYHAITSDRPYRTGQSHAFARRIVTENAGTQFDPAIVSVFLDVIEQWCIEHEIEDSGVESGIDIVNPLRMQPAAGDDAAAA